MNVVVADRMKMMRMEGWLVVIVVARVWLDKMFFVGVCWLYPMFCFGFVLAIYIIFHIINEGKRSRRR